MRFDGVQVLRGVAASFVVLDHSMISLTKIESSGVQSQYLSTAYALGNLGVHLFFAISGFLMMYLHNDKFGSGKTAALFFLRRLLRIWPIYIIATTIVLIGRYNGEFYLHFDDYLRSIFFIPYRNESGLYQPLLGQGWTLNFEMFFYSLFAIALVFQSRIGRYILVFPICMLIFIDLMFTTRISFFADSVLTYFVLGIVVSQVSRVFKMRSIGLSCAVYLSAPVWALMILLEVFLGRDYYFFVSLGGIPVTVLLFVRVEHLSSRLNRVLVAFGDGSYSTYLFHGFLITISKTLLSLAFPVSTLGGSIFIFIALLGSNVFGFVSYLVLERSLNSIGQRFILRLQQTALFVETRATSR